MARTFAYRRQEIVNTEPRICNLQDRWPALFEQQEINEEFQRLVARPLETKFFAQLDKYGPALMALARSKGGEMREKILPIIHNFDQSEDVGVKREWILKALIVLLGEDVTNLFKEYNEDDIPEELEQVTMAVFHLSSSPPDAVPQRKKSPLIQPELSHKHNCLRSPPPAGPHLYCFTSLLLFVPQVIMARSCSFFILSGRIRRSGPWIPRSHTRIVWGPFRKQRNVPLLSVSAAGLEDLLFVRKCSYFAGQWSTLSPDPEASWRQHQSSRAWRTTM
ncbi:hypothetical protein WMY93_029572 [Mugilogobius chulae]|uniref:Uncharacterized protein n=1 Tax=Mugilogobius chulae TaxID=88201 RepID=A0AAW0MKA4_9GOBI